ncbi:MAG: cupin domain-containing protein [Rhodospirillaceae bacterium]
MKRLAPYMTRGDDRGQMTGITQDLWHEANFVESKAGIARGRHYHKDTEELFYIISGHIKVETIRMADGHRAETTLTDGDILLIEPGEWHLFTTLTDSRWINMLSKAFDPNNPDMITPDTLPPPPSAEDTPEQEAKQ